MGGLKPAAWLSQLAPAHPPPPPGWWPLAPGWWGLIMLLLLALAGLAYWQTRPTVRWRRVALRELKQLAASECALPTLALALEQLLRRYAMAQFGRETVAELSGERWLAFMAAHGGQALAGAPGRDLLRAAYGGDPGQAERRIWLEAARGFIKGRKK